MNTTLRWMQESDLPELVDIERDTFRLPRCQASFLRSSLKCMVAESGGKAVAYIVYEETEDQIYLFNLAVKESHRRQGIGKQLVSRVACIAVYHNKPMRLRVRETNLNAQLFFKALGFRANAVVRWHMELDEDAYEMYREGTTCPTS